MQTETEFKELARCWIEDISDFVLHPDDLENMLVIAWRSYNCGINDFIRQDS